MPTLDDVSFLFTDNLTSLAILIPVISALVTILDWIKNHAKVVRFSDPTHLTLLSTVIGTVCLIHNLFLLAYVAYIVHLGTLFYRFSKQRTTYNGHSDLVKFQNNLAACLNPTIMLFVTMNLHGLYTNAERFIAYSNQHSLIYSNINSLYLSQRDIIDSMNESTATMSRLVNSMERITTSDKEQVELIQHLLDIENRLIKNIDSIKANQTELLSIQINQAATVEQLRSPGLHPKSNQD